MRIVVATILTIFSLSCASNTNPCDSPNVPIPAMPSSSFEIAKILGVDFFFSFEEDAPEGSVFRPKEYNFPPSYPRPGFRFDANGAYTFHEPAPDDGGTISSKGTWRQLSKSNVFLICKDGKLEDYVALEGGPNKMVRRVL